MNGHEQLEVDGIQPSIEGASCEELIAVQYWYAGDLTDPANTVHLKFGGSWHRLYFDCGIIFWRDGDEPPEEFDAPEIQAKYRLDDVGRRHGLLGLTLASINPEPTQRGSRVILTFQGGGTVTFFNEDDRSGYAC